MRLPEDRGLVRFAICLRLTAAFTALYPPGCAHCVGVEPDAEGAKQFPAGSSMFGGSWYIDVPWTDEDYRRTREEFLRAEDMIQSAPSRCSGPPFMVIKRTMDKIERGRS